MTTNHTVKGTTDVTQSDGTKLKVTTDSAQYDDSVKHENELESLLTETNHLLRVMNTHLSKISGLHGLGGDLSC